MYALRRTASAAGTAPAGAALGSQTIKPSGCRGGYPSRLVGGSRHTAPSSAAAPKPRAAGAVSSTAVAVGGRRRAGRCQAASPAKEADVAGAKSTPTHPHPLEELTADEIRMAAASIRAHAKGAGVSEGELRFNVISLNEPPKAQLVAYQAAEAAGGKPVPPARQAFVIIQRRGKTGVVEAVVSLPGPGNGSAPSVVAWEEIENVQALATPDDCFEAEAIAKADPRVIKMLEERYGVTDMNLVACDPWSIHNSPLSSRAIQCFMYLKLRPEGNQYAHPIDMVPLVDMDAGKVVDIEVHRGELDKVDWNKVPNEYDSRLQTVFTADPPKPLNITQPEGPSFRVDGNRIEWQKWSFRLGFNYREGVVLHDLRFKDGGRERPVMQRVSLVEMAVPYADANAPYNRKCAFDVGDYGLGYTTNSLSLGCDCLGHIRYFDATLSNAQGEPVTLPSAVCMHEEDTGLLYKHVDFRTGHSESRRQRRLVISHISTVVNYEYAFYWYLYQDGTIALDIKLTGELSTNMLSTGEDKPDFGILVGPNVNAQHHQHMFCARIDPAIDDDAGGKSLVVTEVNVQQLAADDPRNGCKHAWVPVETELETVHAAAREIAPEKGRIWKMKNPGVANAVTGAPVAYKLLPMAHPPLLALEGSVVHAKGHFATKQLWVTPHHDKERYPSGDYVLGKKDCSGLKVYTAEDKKVSGADPVLWYTFGVTHVIRPEDFPIMNVEVCGFQMKPYGFFEKNPCLDLPMDANKASKLDGAEPCCSGSS